MYKTAPVLRRFPEISHGQQRYRHPSGRQQSSLFGDDIALSVKATTLLRDEPTI